MENAINKKTLVVGASPNPERYAWRAITQLRRHGHEVVAYGKRKGSIGDVEITDTWPTGETFDTITLYLGAERQAELEADIVALQPKRIVFNPGAENDHLADMAEESGIEAVEGCTLVMLTLGNY